MGMSVRHFLDYSLMLGDPTTVGNAIPGQLCLGSKRKLAEHEPLRELYGKAVSSSFLEFLTWPSLTMDLTYDPNKPFHFQLVFGHVLFQ